MSVSSTINREAYAGDGVTTVFPFAHLFTANADLNLVVRDDVTGVETPLILGTDYSVVGAGGAFGGSVTLVVALLANTTLTIYRDTPETQPVVFTDGRKIPADVLNGALDRLTIIAQRVKDLVSRSIRLSDGVTDAFDLTIPSLVGANAGDVFSLNPTLDGLVFSPLTTGPTGAAGANGTNGTNGTNGATWRDGSGVPSNALGVDGDFYVDTVSPNTFYKRVSGAYVSQGNLQGNTGAAGSAGTAAQETPSGTIDGSNTSFGLAHTPTSALVLDLYVDGVYQRQGTDYTISTATITFTTAPATSSDVWAKYYY